ncbi:hypothetical protein NLJ89_g10730 [Agrocybe chaxingu]|uniref:Fungal-type protein kinase domain-containing protein n=1 Tax=Agrocybe chaxingu TaxID=84603 RepID=A0A9W8JR80_9AGAR|nr:hypothetical protein NLJ89_g10730 [Agrocybe chaxingu]
MPPPPPQWTAHKAILWRDGPLRSTLPLRVTQLCYSVTGHAEDTWMSPQAHRLHNFTSHDAECVFAPLGAGSGWPTLVHFLKCMRDALHIHRELNDREIPYKDINLDSIFLVKDPQVEHDRYTCLVDHDRSTLRREHPSGPFMALDLVSALTENSPMEHALRHDLEAFAWVSIYSIFLQLLKDFALDESLTNSPLLGHISGQCIDSTPPSRYLQKVLRRSFPMGDLGRLRNEKSWLRVFNGLSDLLLDRDSGMCPLDVLNNELKHFLREGKEDSRTCNLNKTVRMTEGYWYEKLELAFKEAIRVAEQPRED